MYPLLDLFFLDSWESSRKDPLWYQMKVMDAQEGGWIVLQNKSSNKNNTRVYTGSVYLTYVQFSTTQAEFHYLSGFKSGSPETLQRQVLNEITCNLTTTSFTQGSLATFLTSFPLHLARVQPLQIKDFLTKFSLRTDSVTHLSTINALITDRDLTTMSTE